ncbi:filamentous muscle protein titin-animal, related protein [Ceratobasidium sp. AG-Ba]|nr:filamentous muscle protein titin-animal, related protein [Ceratobasidium sp. AG-Ba]
MSSYGVELDHFWRAAGRRQLIPLVEREMISLSYALRSKESWWLKFRTPEISERWRAEAIAQARRMKESHVDYVLDELDGFDKLRDELSGAEVWCFDGIWQSDRLVSADLKARIITGATRLENVPDEEKDWHPRSSGQVLDLVHPSLYPIVYGRTSAYPERVTKREPYQLAKILAPNIPLDDDPWSPYYHISRKFQWLPTDFAVSKDGKSVKSLSYINNVHPDECRELHIALEDLIGTFIPLFERVLTDLIPRHQKKQGRTINTYRYDSEYAPMPRYDDYGDLEEHENAYYAWYNRRPIEPPEVANGGYIFGSLERREMRYSLAGRTVQVIVKLANIHLTPENSTYAGGTWHVEGMSSEAIAASGIYYYDEENVTESRLAFRAMAYPPSMYDQDDESGCMETWGIQRDDICIHELGSVITCQDRAIAFPNTYQHRVSSFELEDKTKPGHRKIVALFLVDPGLRRLSTTTVPPQQHDWTTQAIFQNPALKRLSPEIVHYISTLVEGTMTGKEAGAYRLELMDERSSFAGKFEERFSDLAFNMCEH